MYRLVEEKKLRRLIYRDMIYRELSALGVDNWIGWDKVHFPDTDEINTKLNEFDKYEKRNNDD